MGFGKYTYLAPTNVPLCDSWLSIEQADHHCTGNDYRRSTQIDGFVLITTVHWSCWQYDGVIPFEVVPRDKREWGVLSIYTDGSRLEGPSFSELAMEGNVGVPTRGPFEPKG